MALTDEQASELRSLLQTWSKASNEVREMLQGAAVTTDGLDMEVLRRAIDSRSQAEQLLILFWSRAMHA